MTDQEISTLKVLNENYKTIFNKLGKLTISEESLRMEKDKLILQYTELMDSQVDFEKEINEKYGDVKINIQNWEIINNKPIEDKKET